MADSLSIALVHARLKRDEFKYNFKELLELNKRAAESGARVIVNTETGLSGYGFDSRPEVSHLTRLENSTEVQAFAELAKEYAVYLALGLAEKDSDTGLYFNSAVLFGPDGKVAAKHRKLTSESKWAAAGGPRQMDVCDTPWGRIGLLICSESYFSILPRTMALKGADLLILPANWPNGGIDTRVLWQARALENGFYLAGCNRAGKDRDLDFHEAFSSVHGPDGTEYLASNSLDSKVFLVDLPLVKGKLDQGLREQRLKTRRPEAYHYLAADLSSIGDLSGLFKLPKPGGLRVNCLSLPQNQQPEPTDFESLCAEKKSELPDIWLLSPGLSPQDLKKLISVDNRAVFCPDPDFPDRLWFAKEGECLGLDPTRTEPLVVDYGPARLGMALGEDLLHPEMAECFAKRGCDLVLASGGDLADFELKVLEARSLDKISLALVHRRGSLIVNMQKGHAPWQAEKALGGEVCSLELDTNLTRVKNLRSNWNFELLLKGAGHKGAK
jgi:predicted amidohydrolase